MFTNDIKAIIDDTKEFWEMDDTVMNENSIINIPMDIHITAASLAKLEKEK